MWKYATPRELSPDCGEFLRRQRHPENLERFRARSLGHPRRFWTRPKPPRCWSYRGWPSIPASSAIDSLPGTWLGRGVVIPVEQILGEW